jgi:hypothetical protein
MVNCIATCGDSFGTGSGLPLDICFEKSFAGIVAEHFQLPQKVYARGGCCNFTIYLQVKKIIERTLKEQDFKPFVLITITHHERLIIPLDDGLKHTMPDLSQVDYRGFLPYDYRYGKRPLEFTPTKIRLFTQTITNLELLLKEKSGSISRFTDKESEKLDTLGEYYSNIFDTGIKKEYDDSLIVTMHSLLKFHSIDHVILTFQPPYVIDKKNVLNFHWGEFTLKYPDEGRSGHCNEEGNRLAGMQVIEHIKTYNLL